MQRDARGAHVVGIGSGILSHVASVARPRCRAVWFFVQTVDKTLLLLLFLVLLLLLLTLVNNVNSLK